MTIDKQIENLQYQIKKVDGKSLNYNILNRAYGLGHVGMQILLYYATDKNPLSLLYLPLAMDGAVDLATGMHHTLMFRILKIHPKYELEKLLANQSPNNLAKNPESL